MVLIPLFLIAIASMHHILSICLELAHMMNEIKCRRRSRQIQPSDYPERLLLSSFTTVSPVTPSLRGIASQFHLHVNQQHVGPKMCLAFLPEEDVFAEINSRYPLVSGLQRSVSREGRFVNKYQLDWPHRLVLTSRVRLCSKDYVI
jgi:hypothetical protein